jgi:hypothetical protein
VIDRLLASDEPSIRFKALVHVLDHDLQAPETRALQEEIRSSSRVQTLLSEQDSTLYLPHRAYSKWLGAHWVLSILADTGYPPGDARLVPLRDQVLSWLFSDGHRAKIGTIDGRVRRCASQEGNALWSLLVLGLADGRCDQLARDLQSWQWPDGGWNCDRKPEAHSSSFMESLIPLRALSLHARLTGSPASRQAADRAAEVFLVRRLFRRRSDGSLMRPDFAKLHYPCYWHYDILFGLKVLVEGGYGHDPRCTDALDLLESKRLPDGGFPAEGKYYQVGGQARSGRSLVDWGGTSRRRMNPWVTIDALYVLKATGRFLPAGRP